MPHLRRLYRQPGSGTDTVWAIIRRYVWGWAFVAMLGCASSHPIQVNQPASVSVDTAQRFKLPIEQSIIYRDVWHAIAAMDFNSAKLQAENGDVATLVSAIEALVYNDQIAAEQLSKSLLRAQNTSIRDATRLTYGAALTAQGKWESLAEVARLFPDSALPRDQAGVERWAKVFASTRTTATFTDSVVSLQMQRTATGAPVIVVQVNGITKRFWLDTGSSITILTAPVAAECGALPLSPDTLELFTVVGRLPALATVLQSLQVGGYTISDAPAMIVDATALQLRANGRFASRSEPVDGIIGFDVISKLDLLLDFGSGQVTIRRPSIDPTTTERSRNLFWFGIPIISAVTNNGRKVLMALDTGAEESYGTQSFAQKTQIRPKQAERRTIHGFGGSQIERGYMIPKATLFMGRTKILLERLFLYNARYPTIFDLDGTLGADFAAGTTLRLDMTNGRAEIGEHP